MHSRSPLLCFPLRTRYIVIDDVMNKERNRQRTTLDVDLAGGKRRKKIEDDVDDGAREVHAAMRV